MTKIQKTFALGFILVNMLTASYFTFNAFTPIVTDYYLENVN